MKALGLETSATTCSVALFSDHLLASESITHGPTHSQTLLPFVKKVLEDADTKLEEISVIAITSGPGSFTGLRIGISCAKGLAFFHHIPCVALSTLEALAMNALDFDGYLICPVMDARRCEFYNALFEIRDSLPCRLTPDRAISGEELVKEIENANKLLILGDGAEKFVDMFPAFSRFIAPETIRYQSAVSVALLGLRDFKAGKAITCEELSPSYLRLPQAEREWNSKNNKE